MNGTGGFVKRLARIVQLAGIALAASFVSALCNPPPPTCNAQTCPQGQYLLAGNCVAPIPPYGDCVDNQHSICASSPAGSPFGCFDGTCLPGAAYGQQCNFEGDCGYDFAADRPTHCSCPADGIRRCGFYQRTFGSCDACSPCEPGLSCVGGKCIQACSSALDCPCDADGNPAASCQTVSGSQQPNAARCVQCQNLGQSCDDEVHPCCNGNESCSPTSHTCCRNEGAGCSTKADCCGGGDICKNNACEACHQAGNSCDANSDCCLGTSCKGGSCAVDCTPGVDCIVPGQTGICAHSKTSCDPLKGAQCTQTQQPTTETCDGKDDDCNGKIDDIAPTPCTNGTVVDATCQSGFTAPGTMQCVKGKATCVATRCDTNDPNATNCYCTQCGAAIGGKGGPCGVCGGTNCVPGVDLCIPSSVCSSGPGSPPAPPTCHKDTVDCSVFPSCWTPADLKLPPNQCYGS